MVVWLLSRVWLLWPHRLQPARLLCPWDSPGKNTGVGCHFLLQGIFPTQESNLGLPHCRQTLYRLSLPFTIPSKRVKYLGINSTKEIKNCKTLQKFRENRNKRTSYNYGLENLTLLKCPYYQSDLQIHCCSCQIHWHVLQKLRKKNPKISMESQGTLSNQSNFNDNRVWALPFPNFKTC